MKLNLGCGMNKRDGYINIDCERSCGPDEVWNLEQTPWKLLNRSTGPILGNSIEEILAHHVLEHLGFAPTNFLAIMKEIYRILVPGGTIEIRVPHHMSEGYWGDPTHVRPINPAVLSLFSKKECQKFAENNWPNTPLATYLDIDLEIRSTNFALLPYWGQRYTTGQISKAELDHAMATYWNVVGEITIVMFKAS